MKTHVFISLPFQCLSDLTMTMHALDKVESNSVSQNGKKSKFVITRNCKASLVKREEKIHQYNSKFRVQSFESREV